MEQTLHERLKHAAGERNYRELAQLTATSPETVRRYMLGQSPSAEFLSSLCAGTGVNGEWLLTGRGPVHKKDVRATALRDANVTELLSAMSVTLERLIERVERLEVFLQSMEARLRGRAAPAPVDSSNGSDPPPRRRAESITDAITRRPPPDGG
jgi:transcriptional regulator with XRE-family HTH domain